MKKTDRGLRLAYTNATGLVTGPHKNLLHYDCELDPHATPPTLNVYEDYCGFSNKHQSKAFLQRIGFLCISISICEEREINNTHKGNLNRCVLL